MQKLINYLLNEASEIDVEDFMGYSSNDLTAADIENVAVQMPEEELLAFCERFGIKLED